MAIKFLNTVAVDDNVLFVDTINDRVGIGTDSPSYKLTSYSTASEGDGTNEFPIVAGKANAIGNFTGIGLASYIAANGAVKAGIALERVGSYGTGKLHFLNNDTLDNLDATLSDSKMTILRGGNVGIGTTSPDSELDVRSDSSTEPVVLKLGNAVASGDNDVIISQLSTFIDNSNEAADELGRIQVQNKSDSHDDGIMSFWTRDGVNNVDAARRMTIDGSGRVGIGIDAPLNTLSIESPNSPLIKIRNTTNAGGASIEFNDNAGSADTQNGNLTYRHSDSQSQGGGSSFNFLGQDDQVIAVYNNGRIAVGKSGSTSKVGYGFIDDIDTGMYRISANQLGFSTDGSNAITIDDSQNVGIGTTSPGAPLSFANSVGNKIDFYHNTGGTSGDRYGIEVQPSELRIYSGAEGDSTGGITFGKKTTSTFTEAMRIRNDGNVGIGTTSPGEKLEVEGNVKIKDVLLSNQEELDASTGANVIANVAIATYTAAFFDYVIKKSTNVRSGTVYACHDGTNVEFTETSTNDLGDTSDVTLSVDISGANMRLLATVTSDDWSVKSLIRAI